MKQYLTKFSTRAEYAAALANLDYPNVSYVDGEEGVIFNPEMPLIVDNKISGTHTGDDILLTFTIVHGDNTVSEEVSIPVTEDTWEYEWTGEDKIRWFGNWATTPYTAAKMSAPMLKAAAQPVFTLTLDHFGFDISDLISVETSFQGSSFDHVDVHGIDVSHLKDLTNMFMTYEGSSLDMHGVDLRNVKVMRSTFAPMAFIEYLNLDGCLFNTESDGKNWYALEYSQLFEGFGTGKSEPTISLKNSDAGTLEIIKDALSKSETWNMDTRIDTGDLIWTYNQSTKEWEGNPHKDDEPTTERYEIRVFDDSVSEMVDEINAEIEVYVKLYDTETDTYLEDAQDWNLKAYNNATGIETEAVEIEDGSNHEVEGAWYLMVNGLSHEDIDSVRLVAVNAFDEEDVLAERVVTVNGL